MQFEDKVESLLSIPPYGQPPEEKQAGLVEILKANPPLSLVDLDEIKRTLTSSATTSQLPSLVVLDSPTARRMTKGIVTIVRDFIGTARRPYLVVDTPGFQGSSELGARGAAIQGLQPFASETTH